MACLFHVWIAYFKVTEFLKILLQNKLNNIVQILIGKCIKYEWE